MNEVYFDLTHKFIIESCNKKLEWKKVWFVNLRSVKVCRSTYEKNPMYNFANSIGISRKIF